MEMPLKDGKMMRKGPIPEGRKNPSVVIAASFFQPWSESDCNSQFTYHFHRIEDDTTKVNVLSSDVEGYPPPRFSLNWIPALELEHQHVLKDSLVSILHLHIVLAASISRRNPPSLLKGSRVSRPF